MKTCAVREFVLVPFIINIGALEATVAEHKVVATVVELEPTHTRVRHAVGTRGWWWFFPSETFFVATTLAIRMVCGVVGALLTDLKFPFCYVIEVYVRLIPPTYFAEVCGRCHAGAAAELGLFCSHGSVFRRS
jgi:hypothetical protein